MSYHREYAIAYAHKWAYTRNPKYLDFHGLGGDCTNFVSQCLLAGGAPMNYKPTFGWYYKSARDRAPAWTGVKYLYNFLTGNRGVGPFAVEVDVENISPGDIIQLAFQRDVYAHTLLVVETGPVPSPANILIATHTMDSDNRLLDSYHVYSTRFLKIDAR